jgi:hypothetical protein
MVVLLGLGKDVIDFRYRPNYSVREPDPKLRRWKEEAESCR